MPLLLVATLLSVLEVVMFVGVENAGNAEKSLALVF